MVGSLKEASSIATPLLSNFARLRISVCLCAVDWEIDESHGVSVSHAGREIPVSFLFDFSFSSELSVICLAVRVCFFLGL